MPYVDLTLKYEKEEDKWVGVCLQLTTSTFGDSLTELQEDLIALVEAHMDVIHEDGELTGFFEEHGIVVQESRPESVRIDVELPDEGGSALYQFLSLPVPAH